MTRGKAIYNMCKECIYDPYQLGTWKQQVTACTSPKCPLFPYRPITRGKVLGSKENGYNSPLSIEKG